jgi:hypothetical protein
MMLRQEPAMSAEEDSSSRRPFVRPYAVTGGRTRPSRAGGELELEALVSTTSRGEASVGVLALERRTIAELCRDILSVAEVSARLEVPLGVARVLIGDMAEEGLVAVHRPTSPSDRPDLALLERVLYGLREI